ncbi:MAG: formyltransferase family protein [Bacteroidales bacterium]|nr:hypothetical protein [Lentimicrobiaceae bacterium]MDD5695152.1 formyltransferase family protein [Bacteroidales bacterium]
MVNQQYTVIRELASEWGELILPASKRKLQRGLRILLFGSTTAGHLVLKTLLHFDRNHPGKIDIRAVATDDTRDPLAKIGIRKRVWKYYSSQEQRSLMDLVIQEACSAGIPCYTGGVKNDYFKGLLQQWDPELILMCCFGQKIDGFIYRYPSYGMYNFHPSDLVSNIGAGAKPFESTILEGRTISKMILHMVTENIDGGPIVGISPPVSIVTSHGTYPDNFLVLQEKIPSICGWMTYGLLASILDRQDRGDHEMITSIDYERIIPRSVKEMLMEPVTNDPLKIKKLPFPE